MSTPVSFPAPGAAATQLRGQGTRAMVVGAAVSAAGAIAFQLIGARALGEVDFAPIALLWTLQFLVFSVLYMPVEQLIIRRLTLSGGRAGALRSAAIPAAVVVVVGAAAGAGWVAATKDGAFQGRGEFVVIAFLLFLAMGVYAVARGFLAGRRRFFDYGVAVSTDAVARIGFTVVALVVAASSTSLGWAMVAAPLAALAVRPFRAPDGHAGDALPDPTRTGPFLSGMLVATAASQTILAAGPLVVDILGADEAAITVFFVTFTLFRGPLTASYNLLARVLPWFTRAAASGADARIARGALLTVVGTTLAALVAAGGAAVLGPFVVDALFGVRPSSELAALAAGGVVVGAVALFLGQVLVGRGTTGRLAAAWLVAVVVAAVVLVAVDASPTMRTAWAFVAGQATALAATAAAVARPHPIQVPTQPGR